MLKDLQIDLPTDDTAEVYQEQYLKLLLGELIAVGYIAEEPQQAVIRYGDYTQAHFVQLENGGWLLYMISDPGEYSVYLGTDEDGHMVLHDFENQENRVLPNELADLMFSDPQIDLDEDKIKILLGYSG